MNLKNTENIFVLGVFLGVIGLISALVLAVFTDFTRKPIEEAQLRSTNEALRQILPAFDNQPSEDTCVIDGVTFMGAVKDGKLIALAAESSSRGYAGPVQGLIGLNPDGTIRAVLITKQNETPGLGANVCQRQFRKTIFNLFEKKPEGLAPNPFLDQFTGKSLQPGQTWKVRKDGGSFDYVTGATVTSRAVTALADHVVQVYSKNRDEITARLSEVK